MNYAIINGEVRIQYGPVVRRCDSTIKGKIPLGPEPCTICDSGEKGTFIRCDP